ncbi:MAG: hypothetical protein K6A41_10385 [Bacteroidales bacterium]|nr:hypothetical protein [Bacteroidales bacterium]
MKKILSIIAIALLSLNCIVAQTTKEEFKAEQQEIRLELKSEKAIKQDQKIEGLMKDIIPEGGTMDEMVESMLASYPKALRDSVTKPLKNLLDGKESRIVVQPNKTGLNSVDGLVNTLTPLLAIAVSTSEILAEYKRDTKELGEGEYDLIKFNAHANDYVAILPLLAQASIDAAKASEQLKTVQADIKKLSPMQAVPATKAFNWSKDALNITQTKLAETTKLLKNLINGLKAWGNL